MQLADPEQRRQRAGVLLCLCSRNNEQDVDAVFAAHPDMPLRRDQFVAARIDWEPKSANLRSLAAQLDLGLDSFVFVDDDPVVCAEVRASCPEVLTLCLPGEPDAIPGFLAAVWPLDLRPATGEDLRRTELYRANAEREQLRAASATLADFLASLELEVSIEAAAPRHAERIAQLTARTTQFNSTTLRLTEREIAERIAANRLLAVTVSDRFGDYGLVGAVLFGDEGGDLAVTGLMLWRLGARIREPVTTTSSIVSDASCSWASAGDTNIAGTVLTRRASRTACRTVCLAMTGSL